MVERIKSSVFALLVANVFSIGSALLSVVFSALYLDQNEYADWVALSTVAFVTAPIGVSAQVAAVRRTVVDQFKLGDLLCEIRVPLIWTSLLIIPIGNVFSAVFDLPLIGVYAALSVLPSGILQGTLFGWFQGRSQFNALMWIAVVIGALRVLAVYVAFNGEQNPVSFGALYQSAASVVVIIVICVFMRLRDGVFDNEHFRVRDSLILNHLPALIFMTALISTDVLISRLFLADDQLASYATGSLLSKAIGVVPSAVTAVVLPSMFAAKYDVNERLKYFVGVLVFSILFINLGFVTIGWLGLSDLFKLSSTALIQFSALGAAFAVLTHVGYEGIAKLPAMTSATLFLIVMGLVSGLIVSQPNSIFGLVAMYLTAAIVSITVLVSGIKKSNLRQ